MNYGLLVDIILVMLFCGCVYLCGRNGFIKTVAVCLAVLISAGCAYFLTARVSPYVARSVVNPLIERSLERSIEKHVSEDAMGTLDSAVNTAENVIDKLKEKFSKEEESENEAGSAAETAEAEEESAAKKVTNVIGGALTAVLLFFIFYALILAILRVLIDSLSFLDRIPIVGPLNTTLGIVLGLIVGFALIAVPIWAIQHLLPSLLGDIELLSPETIEKSRVISFIVRHMG